jgi:hypothetical protein
MRKHLFCTAFLFVHSNLMSLKRLNIRGISYSQTQNGAYALILKESGGTCQLPIVIVFEAVLRSL